MIKIKAQLKFQGGKKKKENLRDLGLGKETLNLTPKALLIVKEH